MDILLKVLNNNRKLKLIKSFQRRFRQKLINGKIDRECLIIAEKLSKLSWLLSFPWKNENNEYFDLAR